MRIFLKFVISTKSKLKEFLNVQQFESMKFKYPIGFIKVPSSVAYGDDIVHNHKKEQLSNKERFFNTVYKSIVYLSTPSNTIAETLLIQIKIDFSKFVNNIM